MVILCGSSAVVPSPGSKCPSFEPFSLRQEGLATSEVDVGRRQVVQALVITQVVVVIDERCDQGVEVAWQEGVVEQNAITQGLMPMLDLDLGLRMIRWRTGSPSDLLAGRG